MSAPRLLPKGTDRSWTRAFYYTLNRVARRVWYRERMDEKVDQAVRNSILYGRGQFTIKADWQ